MPRCDGRPVPSAQFGLLRVLAVLALAAGPLAAQEVAPPPPAGDAPAGAPVPHPRPFPRFARTPRTLAPFDQLYAWFPTEERDGLPALRVESVGTEPFSEKQIWVIVGNPGRGDFDVYTGGEGRRFSRKEPGIIGVGGPRSPPRARTADGARWALKVEEPGAGLYVQRVAGARPDLVPGAPRARFTHLTNSWNPAPPPSLPLTDWHRGDPGDFLWLWHPGEGVARYHPARSEWRYFGARRWLRDGRINDLLPTADGGAWVGADGGLSRIGVRSITLEEKALLFHERVSARHDRHGMVATSGLADPYDPRRSFTFSTDNDGLWTAMYLAAECLRYVVTGDPAVREKARRHFAAIRELHHVAGVPGLPARSWDFLDEKTPLHSEYVTKNGRRFNKWRPCDPAHRPGKQWKGDTSSDEIDGHFFILGLYADTVADEAERAECAALARACMDRIIDGGFNLIDSDGEPTTWGHWSPAELNNAGRWASAKGLNSLELLAYLACTWHLTGEARYREVSETLLGDHHYAENTLRQRSANLPAVVNHSDDELSMLSFFTLLRYAPEGPARAIYQQALRRLWEQLREEHNPLWNLIYATLSGEEGDLDAALDSLCRTPLSTQEWRTRNAHRVDLGPHRGRDRHKDLQSTRVIPPDERPNIKYNGNPFRLDGGGDGRAEDDGAFFVFAYWLGRAEGLFVEGRAAEGAALSPLRRVLGLE